MANFLGPSFLMVLLVVSLLLLSSTSGQFFTKTSKSVPRLGRRNDPASASSFRINDAVSGHGRQNDALSGMIEGTPLDRFFRKYDSDGDWCLSPEELWRDGGAAGTLFAAAALARRRNDDVTNNDVPLRGRRISGGTEEDDTEDPNRGSNLLSRLSPLKRK